MNPQPVRNQFATETNTEIKTLVSIITSKTDVEKIVLLGQTILQQKLKRFSPQTSASIQSTQTTFF